MVREEAQRPERQQHRDHDAGAFTTLPPTTRDQTTRQSLRNLKRVYVGNIFYKLTECDVHAVFKHFGNIVEVSERQARPLFTFVIVSCPVLEFSQSRAHYLPADINARGQLRAAPPWVRLRRVRYPRGGAEVQARPRLVET